MLDENVLKERYESLKDVRFTSIKVDDEGAETTTIQAYEEVVAELREEMSAEVAAELASILANKLTNALRDAGIAQNRKSAPKNSPKWPIPSMSAPAMTHACAKR